MTTTPEPESHAEPFMVPGGVSGMLATRIGLADTSLSRRLAKITLLVCLTCGPLFGTEVPLREIFAKLGELLI